MGLKDYLKNKKDEFVKSRTESKAYKKIVDKRVLQARRQAYIDEKIKVEQERAREKARQPSGGGFGKFLSAMSQPARRRYAPARRPIYRRATRRTVIPQASPRPSVANNMGTLQRPQSITGFSLRDLA